MLSWLLAIPGASRAEATPLDPQGTALIQDAAMLGAFEIQASQMALQNAGQENVKEFARYMLLEHELISARLASLASAKKVDLSTDLDTEQRNELDRLQARKGADFDTRYIEQVAIGAHEQALERFKAASESSGDAELKAFAAETMKRLQDHLDKAKALARQAATDAGSVKADPEPGAPASRSP
jgi:putative membrane protein